MEKKTLRMEKLLKFGRPTRLGGRGESTEKKLKKYGVFDLPGCTLGFQEKTCSKLRPCSTLLTLYAKMGLHRYNLLQGTKFQLNGVKKYIKPVGCAACPYYITLDAVDPTGGSSLQTFQTKVSEESYRKFILTSDITRIRGQTRDDDPASMLKNIRVRDNDPAMLTNFRMPEWPPQNPFDIYYLLKKSELQDNDWIHLYLELAVATAGASDDSLSTNLEIVKVAIADEGGLNANNATLYIRYNDMSLGKVSDRIAIVRRSFDEDTGCFLLLGQTRESSQVIPNKRKVAYEDTGPFILMGQDQSSEIIQCSGGLAVDKPFAEHKRTKLHLTGLANQISSPLATGEDPNQLAVNYDADAAGVSMVE